MKKDSAHNYFPEKLQQLSEWYYEPLGKALAYIEQQELDKILPDLFGYHLLQIGSAGSIPLSASRILHKVVMGGVDQFPGNLIGIPEHMPIQPDCIDAVILQHALDIANAPHQVLREAEQVLVPEGHIIIVGFNPYSFWGLRRLFSWRRRSAPWNSHFLSATRVRDWLALLGFKVLGTQYHFYRLPVNHSGMLTRFRFMERWSRKIWPIPGGVYIIVARKQVSTMTPIKPRWRPARNIVTGLSDAASRSYKRETGQKNKAGNLNES